MLSAAQLAMLRQLSKTFQTTSKSAWSMSDVLEICRPYGYSYGDAEAVLEQQLRGPGLISVSPDELWCKLTDYGRALYQETEALQKEWEELPVIPLDDAEKDQIIIKAGETFRGKIFVTQLFKRARSVIRLHDNYCSHEQLLWLYAVPASVAVRILTSPKALKQDPAFGPLYRAFANERKMGEMRTTTDVHDRKLIIDDTEAFQVGESLKDIGRKGTTIVRLKNVPEHIAQFNALWHESNEIA